MNVYVPLGRYDEALTQITRLLAVSDLSDPERTWLMLNEGFLLLNANRLASAEAAFTRIAISVSTTTTRC